MKHNHIQTIMIITVFFSVISAAQAADIAVIVNKGNSNAVGRSDIEKIYKGEMTMWAEGGSIVAMDLPEAAEDRAVFSTRVLGKSVSVVKALWAVKLFSGKATPPKVANSDTEVRNFVAGNRNAIGYINASALDDGVKAVLIVK